MYQVDVFLSMKWGKEVGISRFLQAKKGSAGILPFLESGKFKTPWVVKVPYKKKRQRGSAVI